MRKSFYLLAALTLVLAGCQKEADSPRNMKSRVSLGAELELPSSSDNTKSVITDLGVFSWSTGDKIQVYSDGLTFSPLTLKSGEATATATFDGTIVGTVISKVAVFPANLSNPPSLSENTLTLNLPNLIPWVEGEADNLMIARDFSDGASSVSFKNIGGLIKVTINNIPATANKVTFLTGKRISGAFTCDISETLPEITAGEDSEADADGVTFTFAAGTAENMVFYVPVPLGTYSKIAFKVKHDNDVLTEFSGSRSNTVTRGKLLIMPQLTLTTITGGGEGGLLSVVVPANYNGTFVLPRTTANVQVLLNTSTSPNAVTIAYDGDDPSYKPANIFMELATGAHIDDFSLNLPVSHVELEGSGVISNITAHTSLSTLVVGSGVTLGELEVTGGGLELNALSTTSVTVNIPPTAANESEEKVNIAINSEVQNLTVTHAASDDVPDKVFVTIGKEASVTGTLSVTESNCNLYVEKGASVGAVSTQASENTVSGTVATLAASGEGTTVVVTETATVTSSITSTDNATVLVDTNATGSGTEQGHQSTSSGGTINETTGEIVATIGSNAYNTLTAAFAAAENGQTVKLLADYNATSEPMYDDYRNLGIDKGITVDGAGHVLTVKGRGIAVGAKASSNIDVTFKDITIQNSTSEARCIDTRGHIGTLILDNATLDTQ